MDGTKLNRRTAIKTAFAAVGVATLPFLPTPRTEFDVALSELRKTAHNLLHDVAMLEMPCSVAGACRLLASAQVEADMRSITISSYDALAKTYERLEGKGIAANTARRALLQVAHEMDKLS